MEALEQTKLTRDFMVAIAPEIAHHRLAQLRRSAVAFDEDINRFMSEAASSNAKLTLQWAMSLAAEYVKLYDQATAPLDEPVEPQAPAPGKALRDRAKEVSA